MDFQYRLNRKCLSLLISLILHALLLLLFFTIAFEIIFVGTPENIQEPSNTTIVTFANPQSSLFQSFRLRQDYAGQAAWLRQQEREIEPDEKAEIQEQNSESKEQLEQAEQTDIETSSTENLSEKEHNLEEKELEEAPVFQKPENAAIKDTMQPLKESRIFEPIKQISNYSPEKPQAQEFTKKPTKRTSRRRRIAMLAKAFINDFRNSYRTENQIIGSANPTGIRTNKSYVEDRIDEFKLSDFMQKVHRALAQAIYKTPPISIYSAKNYDKKIVIQIEHFKDGKIKILTFESTGIPEVDYQIKLLLNNVSFPPIPERFGKNSIIYTNKFGVLVKEGTNVCRFYAY